MITLVDYGLGNIQAFSTAYKKMNIPSRIAKNASDLETAERVILPGVGSFDYAMKRLNESGMRDVLFELVLKKKVPVLGICVGMQMLADSSEEGVLPGLGWISGKVVRFDVSKLHQKTHLPHMGWNNIQTSPNCPLFEGLEDAWFYFLHSFHFFPNDQDAVSATAAYGYRFPCAVAEGNIYGVQFHPEKSHHFGTRLLKNFAELR